VGGLPPGGTPTSDGSVVQPPKPSRKFPALKQILIVFGVVLTLALIAFVVVRVVLPRLSGVSDEPITLTWWGLWEDDVVITPIIAEYESQNANVTINYVRQSKEDYRERLTNALAKGEGPDIFRYHNTWTPMFYSDLDKMPPVAYSDAEYVQTFYPVASGDLASNTGGFLGIPLMYDGIVMYVNEDIFANSAIQVPGTWDEVREAAKALTIKDEQNAITQSGAALGRTENVDHWQEILALMMLQNGTDMAQPDVCYKVDEDCLGADALTFFTLFSTVDSVWDETLPNSTAAFAAGKLAMYFGPSWRAFEINELNPGLNYRTAPLPQLPKDDPGIPDMSYATYWAEGVWSRSDNKEEAWKFLKYLSERDTLEKFYLNASTVRPFGEPYPRVDMRELLVGDRVLGPIISQAGDAESWYLASRTWDGPTGINSQISAYYEDAVNAVNEGSSAVEVLPTVTQGVAQVLSQYGVSQ